MPDKGPGVNAALDQGIEAQLEEARKAAEGTSSGRTRRRDDAAAMERAFSRVDAAEELLLRMAPQSYLQGRLPEIHSDVRKYLDPNDPRRLTLEAALNPPPAIPLEIDESLRESIVAASTATHSRARQEYARVRSFQNVLGWTAAFLGALAILLGILGWAFPQELSPCFNPKGNFQGEPSKIVCATHESDFPPNGRIPAQVDIDNALAETVRRSDVFLVELLGLFAAAISGARSLRKIRGTSTPYSLPVSLALVKLPAGALTAFLGLVLMRGGFVPGLSALDTAPQILAWAAVFGASQQLVTGVVDRQAKTVLDKVGGKPHTTTTR